ncbi:MAG: Single-stranded-DNA-specific exonuclease RecJ [Candidatus Woesebacteria bacterium GW2011_GWA1_37_7]|uniref:Single-stranded-DNA-specific exonuclease RecJ n=1 Tax=Candidatus Woesebacteria bacterium GW2011_GWA1_37_7 TaxID=1618545 RepID=A0A0G0HC69_9BACT|nr:MAG: Single-stranded-DNA-specific exonuclease RecJ [Candidatus Woesebacteria bacterium GW2011_GWA1_37_7]
MMNNKDVKWEIVGKGIKSTKSIEGSREIIEVLLANRGIKTEKQKDEFFNPTFPEKLTVKSLSLSQKEINKTLKRIADAIKNQEQIIIYGDYDADGICATAILWECLYSLTKNIMPYIPNRFEEGYGLNAESIQKLKIQYKKLKVIITVDNGIVAHAATDKAKELGIDVIITDHHQPSKALTSRRNLPASRSRGVSLRVRDKYDYPDAFAIIHTTQICGSGIAWILGREILKSFQLPDSSRQLNKNSKINKLDNSLEIRKGLDLCAIGTIADQMPLVGINRSFAKYGLEELNKTKRVGLLALFKEAGITMKVPNLKGSEPYLNIGTYEVNFVIAPRINAMGRMEHAIDSLRLICTTSHANAIKLAEILGKVNIERQNVVEQVVIHAYDNIDVEDKKGLIILGHDSYHEGVIGLAASKLVEKFYRPAIVFSKGEKISKASARSISGFNIIEAIHSVEDLIIGGGGHPMAAGFSIETAKIEEFSKKINEISIPLLTDSVLSRFLKVDLEIEFNQLNRELHDELSKFEPSGIRNPIPCFLTKKVNVIDAKCVGVGAKHLKLKLEKDGFVFGAIGFSLGDLYPSLLADSKIDIVFSLNKNVWNGHESLELKIKDLKQINTRGK